MTGRAAPSMRRPASSAGRGYEASSRRQPPSATEDCLSRGRRRAERAANQCDGEWTVQPGFGVYVHIPFCKHRCHYCDFNTYEGQDALFVPYVDELVASIERWEPGRDVPQATSVFFGGGTPTLLPVRELARVLHAVRNRVGLAAGAEVTVEANPETVDRTYFTRLLEAGFNRVSIGVQSLAPHVLAGLGRTHSAEVALKAAAEARRAGVADLNLDLIYGSPWEREADWMRTLAGVIDAAPDHVAAYPLTVEEGTPLHTLVATGRMAPVDPDAQAARFGIAEEALTAAGYRRYEVANWARPGHASAHNLLYWCAGEYLGFGAGAHGHLGDRRAWLVRLPREFIELRRAGRSLEAGHEQLTAADRAREVVMLGLRLRSGVDLRALRTAYGAAHTASLAAALQRVAPDGLVEFSGSRVKIPDGLVLLTNEVLCRVLV